MKRTLITFATMAEAQATLKKTEAVQEEENVYTYSQGTIVITGIGSIQACSAATKYAGDCDCIVNIGIAGTLIDKHAVGTILSVSLVGKHLQLPHDIDAHSKQFADRMHPPFAIEQGPGGMAYATLISSDFPIHNHGLRTGLGEKWDLVDMEGYGICCAAQLLNKPCFLYKLVSDFAKPDGQQDIYSRIAEYSVQLAQIVE
jgi:nucleoside phosphorylase